MPTTRRTSVLDVYNRVQEIANSLDDKVPAYKSLPATAPADYISLSDIREGWHDWATMKAGRKPRNETYYLEVNFVSDRHDEMKAMEISLNLWGLFCDAVMEDIKLGLGEVWPNLVARPHDFELFQRVSTLSNGYRAELRGRLRIENRIP